MSPGRRRGGALLGVLALVSAGAAACGGADDTPDVRRLGVLRSVAASPDEAAFFDELGLPAERLVVYGRDRDAVQVDAGDVASVVRRWVGRGTELLLALSTTTAMAADDATDDVPILFLSNDPVGTGLVENARHPEAMSTGVGYRVPSDRTLALAEEVFGELTDVGCISHAEDPASAPPLADLRRGAAALDMALHCATIREPSDAPAAVAEVAAAGAQVVVVVGSPGTVAAAGELGAALASARVPAITTNPADYAVLTLQPDSEVVYRQLARQARRLLDGVDPADVPVEDPGRFILRLNLSVARQLGISVPDDVVRRADDVVR